MKEDSLEPKDEQKLFYTDSGIKSITVIKKPVIQPRAYANSPIEDIEFTGAVKEIGENAFYRCSNIGNIEFNKGLRIIGDYAFFLCENLTDAELPSSLTQIGKYAFFGCKLRKVSLGGKIESIGEDAFAENHSLSKVSLSKGIVKIGKRAFSNCRSIEEITLPSSIKEIGSGAFESTGISQIILPKIKKINSELFRKSKLESIRVPDSVVEIGSGAFKETPLSSMELSFGLETIGEEAFYACEQLEDVDIPNTVTKIGEGAFSGCRNLYYINLPVSLNEIAPYLFKNCIKLSSISLPYDTRKIGTSAFEHTSLKEVQIPKPVRVIGNDAFSNCEYLERIRLSENLDEIGSGAFSGCESLAGIALPDGLTKIGTGAFTNCGELEFVTIPDKIESIEPSTFCFCEGLKEVTLPKNLKKIGESAFLNCSKLEEIKLPDSVKFIDKTAFSGCESLKTMVIPDGVEFIGDEAFSGCKKLENVTLPKGLVGISNEMFEMCAKLKHIDLPEGLKTISFYAFKGTGLEEIELSDNISFVDAGIFNNCSALKKVRLPKDIKIINDETFSGCISLAEIDLPDGISIIQDEAFFNCSSLTKLDLPKELKYIGKMAFKGCEKLKEIKVNECLERIEEEAFMNCDALEKLELPKSVKYIGNDAFNSCDSLKELTINGGNMEECLFNIGSSLEVVKISEDCKCNAKKLYPLEYLTKRGKYFYLTSEPIDETSESIADIDEKLSLGVLMAGWDNREKLFRELRSSNAENIITLYNYLYRELDSDQFTKFFETKQLKYFNQLCKNYPKFNVEPFYKLYYNLGGFLKPFVEKRLNSSQNEVSQTMDYGQMVTEVFKDVILKNDFITDNVAYVCNSMLVEGFKSGFSRFVINRKNFKEMIEQEVDAFGFISKCYNNFDAVQRTNTSHKGRQRQLQPTLQKFKDYFREVKYRGITEENKRIADVIAPFYSSQSAFDNAVEIDNERKEKNIPTRILKTHLKENIMLTNIDKYSEKIRKLYEDSLRSLAIVAENNFTFDWLEKNDPYNFLLGSLTSSCAHLEGMGFGIMKASMVHPDVQNLVIRNKKGEIVAKSTMFVNRKQGYALLNTVEVENIFTDQEKLAIYRKFKLAVGAFAERYNKENPNNPLKIINVGIHLNRLDEQIKAYDKPATTILTQPNYQEYGNEKYNYNGDIAAGQYTIWQSEDGENNL